ncbi:MAG: patatin-like phospholipase family protein [bacterium]
MANRKLGIALGGGSAKGLAHIGVLQVLEENQVELSCIAGTSIGAVVGAVYAANPSAEELKLKTEALLESEVFAAIGLEFFVHEELPAPGLFRRITDFVKKRYVIGKAALKPYLVGGDKIESVLKSILPDVDIGQLKIPFACVAVDLTTGEDVVFKSGRLIPAIRASMSIPGVFPCVEVGNRVLVDGGATASVPVDAARELGAEFVTGVDLSGRMSRTFERRNGLDINFRVDEIAKRRLNSLRAAKADLLVRPRVGAVHWADFSKLEFCIERGREVTLEALPLLKAELRRMKKRRWWPFQYALDRRIRK